MCLSLFEDELFRTCQTNIECLRQISLNLPRSSNARLNSTQASEQLESKCNEQYPPPLTPMSIIPRLRVHDD